MGGALSSSIPRHVRRDRAQGEGHGGFLTIEADPDLAFADLAYTANNRAGVGVAQLHPGAERGSIASLDKGTPARDVSQSHLLPSAVGSQFAYPPPAPTARHGHWPINMLPKAHSRHPLPVKGRNIP